MLGDSDRSLTCQVTDQTQRVMGGCGQLVILCPTVVRDTAQPSVVQPSLTQVAAVPPVGTPSCPRWRSSLARSSTASCSAEVAIPGRSVVNRLADAGPNLGRPLVDRLKGAGV